MDLARYIDHTLLRADATSREIDTLCAQAREYGLRTVCVNGAWVARCVRELSGTDVAVCSVIGFPLGAMASRAKAFEARCAIEEGALELDMVIALGPLRSGEDAFVREEIEGVVAAARTGGAAVKVILEVGLLDRPEVVRACRLVEEAGADWVKTGTGFLSGGASVEQVELLREQVGRRLGVKAAGGIRDRRTAEALVRAGADRLGTSTGPALVEG